MSRWLRSPRTAALALTLSFGLVAGCHKSGSQQAGTGAAAAGDVPTISDIMQKVNKRKGGLHSDIGEALRADPIDWATVQPKTKEYASLADFLGKNDPPKGDKASWESLSKTYADNAKTLATAVDAKDKDNALSAHNTLQRSCMNCHKAHKGG